MAKKDPKNEVIKMAKEHRVKGHYRKVKGKKNRVWVKPHRSK